MAALLARNAIVCFCFTQLVFIGYSRRTHTPILQLQTADESHGQVQGSHLEAQSRITSDHAKVRSPLASLLFAHSLPASRIGGTQTSALTGATSIAAVGTRATPISAVIHKESLPSSNSRTRHSIPEMVDIPIDDSSNGTDQNVASAPEADGDLVRKTSTYTMSASEADGEIPRKTRTQTILGVTKLVAVAMGCLAAGIMSLFYVTRFFESLMHNTAGSFGYGRRGPVVAGGAGLLSGMLHTLAGPDHFVGLAPMVAGQPISTARAIVLGALWGSGHAVGQLFLGLGFLALQMGLLRFAHASFLAESFSKASGVLVGLALVSIGFMGVKEAREFDETVEIDESQRFGRRSFLTGIFHGLAPDSIVFLAPALALPRLAAILHVSGVFVGTLTTMAFCAAAMKNLIGMGKPSKLKFISSVASILAILFGAGILLACCGFSIQLPFLQGLFA